MKIFNECPICDSKLITSDIVLPEGPLLQCIECGQLVSDCTRELYNDHMKRFNSAEPIDQNYRIHKKRLKRINRYCTLLPRQTQLLDIGCSIGLFLEIAKESGYVSTGVEPAEMATATAHAKGLDVRCGFLEDQYFPDCFYDIITLFEVIEHLENPAGLLRECHRILKPGGVLFISTGNTASWTVNFLKQNWDYFDIDKGHISFFNPQSLHKVIHSAGFTVVNFETRSVKIQSKKNTFTKLSSGLLNVPAKILKTGHDLLFIAKK